jgi:hypothetical protein
MIDGQSGFLPNMLNHGKHTYTYADVTASTLSLPANLTSSTTSLNAEPIIPSRKHSIIPGMGNANEQINTTINSISEAVIDASDLSMSTTNLDESQLQNLANQSNILNASLPVQLQHPQQQQQQQSQQQTTQSNKPKNDFFELRHKLENLFVTDGVNESLALGLPSQSASITSLNQISNQSTQAQNPQTMNEHISNNTVDINILNQQHQQQPSSYQLPSHISSAAANYHHQMLLNDSPSLPLSRRNSVDLNKEIHPGQMPTIVQSRAYSLPYNSLEQHPGQLSKLQQAHLYQQALQMNPQLNTSLNVPADQIDSGGHFIQPVQHVISGRTQPPPISGSTDHISDSNLLMNASFSNVKAPIGSIQQQQQQSHVQAQQKQQQQQLITHLKTVQQQQQQQPQVFNTNQQINYLIEKSLNTAEVDIQTLISKY